MFLPLKLMFSLTLPKWLLAFQCFNILEFHLTSFFFLFNLDNLLVISMIFSLTSSILTSFLDCTMGSLQIASAVPTKHTFFFPWCEEQVSLKITLLLTWGFLEEWATELPLHAKELHSSKIFHGVSVFVSFTGEDNKTSHGPWSACVGCLVFSDYPLKLLHPNLGCLSLQSLFYSQARPKHRKKNILWVLCDEFLMSIFIPIILKVDPSFLGQGKIIIAIAITTFIPLWLNSPLF